MNLYPSYAAIHNACIEVFAPHIKECDCNIEYVVGLTRGGLIPAAILSHLMGDIPMIPVSYSSKNGKGDDKAHNNVLPEIGKYKGFGMSRSDILIVDDICDSGKTLHEVYSHYVMLGHQVFTAVLYYKEIPNGPIVPNVYWEKIPEDAGWVHFPWEIDRTIVQVV